jgi:cadmium resistance protein CadD (predicted permease)
LRACLIIFLLGRPQSGGKNYSTAVFPPAFPSPEHSVTDIIAIIAVVTVAYAATNFDNLAILVALLSRFRNHAAWVVAGHLLVVAITATLAFGIGEAAGRMPVRYVGFLGAIPLAIGLYWAYRLWRPADATAGPVRTVDGGSVLFTTVTSLAANGVDSLLSLAVVFADTASRYDAIAFATVMLAAVLLAVFAFLALKHRRLGPLVEHYASRLAPVVMIAVGCYVLVNTTTDVLEDIGTGQVEAIQ